MLLDNSFASDVRVEKEIKTLLGIGIEVNVFAISNEELEKTEHKNGYIINRIINPIVKHPLKKGYKKYLSSFAKYIAAADFAVIHCHDYHMLFIGAEVKKIKADITLIYDSHEYLKGWPLYLRNKGLINKLKGFLVWNYELSLEKKSASLADAVITITDQIGHKLEHELNLKFSPIVVRNYPIQTNNKSLPGSLHEKLGISFDKKLLVHSGSIYYSDQQLNDLANVILSIENIVLVFIGNRPRFFEVKNKLLKKDHSQSKFYFVDYPTDSEELVQLISSADIGLMHIRNDWIAHQIGSANRYLEYSHAGLAILSTYQDTAVKINKKYNHTLFYDENDFSAFRENLLMLIQDLESYKKRSTNIKNVLTWESEETKLVELYEKLA
jgi:glycosyltransferase involved in cell wall biosynthesis